MAYFVDKYPHHISFTPLQEPKSTAKVKLHVILLPFHTDSKKYSPLVAMIGILEV